MIKLGFNPRYNEVTLYFKAGGSIIDVSLDTPDFTIAKEVIGIRDKQGISIIVVGDTIQISTPQISSAHEINALNYAHITTLGEDIIKFNELYPEAIGSAVVKPE